MKRDLGMAAVLWIAVTAIGVTWAANADIYPIQASEEAVLIDDAFRTLLVLGMPVFTFVVVALLFSAIRYRSKDGPDVDGPPIHTNRWVTIPWLAITGGLAVFVIFNPGLKGIRELTVDQQPDLIVEVVGEKWQWNFHYPEYGVSIIDADELVLPVDRRIRFAITSNDIIHSFWIPAFRMKADAVPGLITSYTVTPKLVSSFWFDLNLRVQCAELCGTGHPRMRAAVRVVEEDQFEAWIEQTGP